MKTKHILTAMVLPAMFAACTAEEIVENNNIAVNANFAEVESVGFTTKNLESRLQFNPETFTWDWEDTDKFILYMADDAKTLNEGSTTNPVYPGDRFAVGTTLTTAYEYAKAEEGGYTTEAPVMREGLYWGYAPSLDEVGRGLVKYELATSQDAEYYKSEEAQAFITPLYEVSSVNYNKNLPLEMVNWYSTVVFSLNNDTDEDITLNQIVLEAQNGKKFLTKGLIDINQMSNYIIAYDGEEWAPKQNLNKKTTDDIKATKNQSVMDVYLDDFRKNYLAKVDEKDGKESSIILLNLEGHVLEAGDTEEFYMMVPVAYNAKDSKNKISEISCNITILAEEGYVEINSANKSNYMHATEIYHNGKKSAFGWKTVDGETVAKSYSISKLNKNEYKRYYVADYTDMMDLIETVNGQFEVVNVGDWNIDKAMADAINESDSYVVFANDVNIGSNEESRATADDEIVITKVSFNGKVVVKEGNDVVFDQITNKYNNRINGTLKIEDDAEVTLSYGYYENATIFVEEGAKLTIGENAVTYDEGKDYENNVITWNTVVYNEGETTLVAQNTVAVEQNGGKLYLNNIKNPSRIHTYKTSNIRFNEVKSFETIVSSTSDLEVDEATTVGAWVIWEGNNGIAQSATLTVNHDLEVNKNLTVEGSLTVEGDTDGSAILINSGSFVNNGIVEVKIENKVDGILYNNDEAESVENDGLIITGRKSKTGVIGTTVKKNEIPGRVDNTNEAQVSVANDSRHIVFYTVEDGSDIDDIESIDFNRFNVNTLNVKGTLTLDRPFVAGTDKDEDGVLTKALSSLKNLQLTEGSVLEIDKNINAVFENVFIQGNAKIEGWSKTESVLTLFGDVNVYLMNKCVIDGVGDETLNGYVLDIEDVTIGSTGLIKFNTFAEPCWENTRDYDYRHLAARILTDHAELNNWMVGDLGDEGLFVNGEKQVKENNADVDNGNDLRKAVTKGVDVTLQKDFALTSALVVTSDVKIDLNNFDLKTGTSYKSEKKGLIRVENGSTVVIEGGVVDASSFNGDVSAIVIPDGNVTINGGEFYVGDDKESNSRNDLILATNRDCNVVINGGKFKYTGTASDGHSYLLNAPNAKGEPVYTVNGGSFYQFIPGTTNPDGWDIEHQLGKNKKVYKNNEKSPTTDKVAEEGAWYHVR